MHDEGTGGNTDGGYGFFPLFPLSNCTFSDCPVGLKAREAKRAAGADGTFISINIYKHASRFLILSVK